MQIRIMTSLVKKWKISGRRWNQTKYISFESSW